MSSVHSPRVSGRTDGRWEVRCPECESSSQSLPIGIGVPITSRYAADEMQANHLGRQQTQAGERVTGRSS
jgi:hypothetical protein